MVGRRLSILVISIQLLGGFALQLDRQALSLERIPRLPLLLACLALHPGKTVPRAQMAYMLWPDSSEKQAQTNLRKLLYYLRQALPDGAPLLEEDNRHIRLSTTQDLQVDLAAFKLALARAAGLRSQNQPEPEQAALAQAVAWYAGELLPGYTDEWLLAERECLRQEFLGAANRLVDYLEQQRRYAEAVPHAAHRLRIDPLSEEAHRQLIRLHALNGDRAAALSAYHACAETLSAQLGVEPDAATRQMYRRIRENAGLPELPAQPIAHPLVGRAAEWQALLASWRLANTRGVRMHLLRGEPGIGKTRLADDFLLWARRQGLPAAAAVCYESGPGSAYAPLAAWLRARQPARLDDHQRRELARILPELLSPQDVAPTALSEEWQQIQFLDAVTQALAGRENSQLLLLLLDDLQWCDRDTLGWLKYVLRTQPDRRILVVGTLLDGELEPDSAVSGLLDLLRREDRLVEASLPRLDLQQTATLANGISGQALPADAVFAESEGVPLFIVELARSRLDAEQARRQAPDEFSTRLQATLTRRMDRLSYPARTLAQAMAVLGQEVSLSQVAVVSGQCEADAMLALDELWQRRLIRETSQGKYTFSHARLALAALNGLSPVRRLWLHLQAARMFEAYGESGLGLAAEHYQQAGESRLAARAFAQAAGYANRLYALEETRLLLEKAIALEAQPDFDLHEQHGNVLRLTGLLQPASEAYGRALVVCQPDNWQAQARLHRRILECNGRVDYDSARMAYQQGLAALLKSHQKDSAYWQEWLELQLSWLRANYWVANTPEVQRVLQALARPLERWGTAQQHLQYRHGQTLHYLLTERFTAGPEQVALARSNVAAARALGSPVILAEYLSSLGLVAYMAGEFAGCEQAYQECLALAGQYNLLSLVERAYAYLSLASRRQKAPEQAGFYADRLAGVLERTGTRSYRMLALAQRGWLAYRAGDYQSAQAQACAALQGWKAETIAYPLQWTARLVLLALAARARDWAAAQEQAGELLAANQQRLASDLEAALQQIMQTGAGWEEALAAAERHGYL